MPDTKPSIEPGSVSVSVSQGIATIRFGHPRGNSLPATLLAQLAEAVTAQGANPEAKVIVLAAEGTGPFCAGASFDELMAVSDIESGRRFFSGFARLILAMIRAPKFIVTQVHGKAAGGGVGIIAASDYAVAGNRAAVKLSELAIGIGPFVVGPVIERKIGLGAYAAMSVDADWRSAEWASQHGLYAELHPTTEAAEEAATRRAAWLAQANPEAMAQLKRVFWQGTEHWEQLLFERAEMSGTLVLSPFTRQAIARFKA
jgi:methylglutaconyl-CoA hydratase